MRLRGTVDSTVTQCANDMWSSWNTSNTALQQRVAETTTAHNNLQSHLARTNQEIYDQQKHISQLQRAIRDKEAPLMVCVYHLFVKYITNYCELFLIMNLFTWLFLSYQKVSQTRLEARTHRPDMELCRDQPFHGLVHEVGQINESVNLLNMKVIKFPLARINLMKLRILSIYAISATNNIYTCSHCL